MISMKYCTKCGAPADDNALYCNACGEPFNERVNNTENNASNDKLMGILSYLGILFLIPLLLAKESEFARFHVNQGLLNFILAAVISCATSISSAISGVFGIIGILEIVPIVFAVMGIVNAYKGEMKELPLIGSIRLIK